MQSATVARGWRPDRACPQPSTRAEALEALVWDQLRHALLHPETLRKGQAVLGVRRGQPDDELLVVCPSHF